MTKKTKTNIRPLNSNVLIEEIEKPVTDGGILLVGDQTVLKGTVIDIGDNILDPFGNVIPTGLVVGDVVHVLRQFGFEFPPLSGQFLVQYKHLIAKEA